MNQTKRTIYTAVFLLLFYVTGGFIDILPVSRIFLLRDISSIYYLALSPVAILYFYRAVTDERIRKYIVVIGSLAALWLVIRIEKYVVFQENITAVRYLWYAYYIPLLMIPQLSFSMALMVDKPNSKRSVFSIISGIVSILFIGVVLTNDLHQLVFQFHNGLRNVDDYSHGTMYFAVFSWTFILMISAVIILLRKCSITANKKLAVVPLVYVTIYFVWIVLISFDKRPIILGAHFGEFPETISFLIDGLIMLCISTGLIPSNISYDKLISTTGFSVQIADNDYKVVYRSPSAIDMTEAQMSKRQFMLDPNTKVIRKNVSGGYAYWQVDISELNQINDELEDVKQTLSEEEEVIRLDNELKEKQAKIDEKSKVYDEIAVRVYNQSIKIEQLSKAAKEKPELFEQNMTRVCVYAAYIKRIANLILLASENERISKVELLLSVSESARHLRKLGVASDVFARFEDDYMLAEEAVLLYETFQYLLEKAGEKLQAISVIIGDDEMKITLEGAVLDLPDSGRGTVEIEDDSSFVTLAMGKERDVL